MISQFCFVNGSSGLREVVLTPDCAGLDMWRATMNTCPLKKVET